MYKKYVKRLLDIFLALTILIGTLPITSLIALIVFIETKENPIFIHERIGLDEKVFGMYKFKSMVNTKDGKKVTKFGHFLRLSSIDELPQILNIIKGEMSFVGPRPYGVASHKNMDKEISKKRQQVLPGITGLVQINGRKSLEMKKRLELDLEYVSNVSFPLDVKIAIKTIEVVLNPSTEEIYQGEIYLEREQEMLAAVKYQDLELEKPKTLNLKTPRM